VRPVSGLAAKAEHEDQAEDGRRYNRWPAGADNRLILSGGTSVGITHCEHGRNRRRRSQSHRPAARRNHGGIAGRPIHMKGRAITSNTPKPAIHGCAGRWHRDRAHTVRHQRDHQAGAAVGETHRPARWRIGATQAGKIGRNTKVVISV